MKKEKIIIGGGKKISKLRIPTAAFLEIPNVEVVEGLSGKQKSPITQ